MLPLIALPGIPFSSATNCHDCAPDQVDRIGSLSNDVWLVSLRRNHVLFSSSFVQSPSWNQFVTNHFVCNLSRWCLGVKIFHGHQLLFWLPLGKARVTKATASVAPTNTGSYGLSVELFTMSFGCLKASIWWPLFHFLPPLFDPFTWL